MKLSRLASLFKHKWRLITATYILKEPEENICYQFRASHLKTNFRLAVNTKVLINEFYNQGPHFSTVSLQTNFPVNIFLSSRRSELY